MDQTESDQREGREGQWWKKKKGIRHRGHLNNKFLNLIVNEWRWGGAGEINGRKGVKTVTE